MGESGRYQFGPGEGAKRSSGGWRVPSGKEAPPPDEHVPPPPPDEPPAHQLSVSDLHVVTPAHDGLPPVFELGAPPAAPPPPAAQAMPVLDRNQASPPQYAPPPPPPPAHGGYASVTLSRDGAQPVPTSSSVNPIPPPQGVREPSPEELALLASVARDEMIRKYAKYGLIALLFLGFFAIALLQGIRAFLPGKYPDSHRANALEPSRKTDFNLAIFTLQLMMLTEEHLLPSIIRQQDLPPDFDDMLESASIESRWAYDGWETKMSLNPAAWTITSAGADKAFGTADDITKEFRRTPQLPEAYWAASGTFENNTQQDRFNILLETNQAELDLYATGLMEEFAWENTDNEEEDMEE